MSNQEMQKVLRSGTQTEKKALFDELLLKVTTGEAVTDGEMVFLEALKKELTTNVVQMSAVMNAAGGVSG